MQIIIRGDSVTIEGYVNAVERLSKPLNSRLGQFVERICKGAFDKALKRADDVRILLNHDWQRDLGGIKDGTLELYEDAIGLRAKATITDKEVIEDARKGNLRGWSFGFVDRAVDNGTEKGLPLREVKDLDLYEVSLINRKAIPAYDGTLVCVRSAEGDTGLNVAEITEATPQLEVVEERAEEKPEIKTDNEPQKTVDYTPFKKIIDEMKGE